MGDNQSGSYQQGASGLTLNICEILLNEDRTTLLKAANSEDLFSLYEDDPNYYIYKEGNSLYLWDLIAMEDQEPEGFRSTKVTFDEHPLIFNKLIEMAIVQLFRDNRYDVYKKRYSSIWEVAIKREKERVFGAVSLRPVLAFSVRNLYSKRGKKQVIALTIRRRYKPVFIGSEDDIQNELADTRGLTRNDNGKIVASSHNVKRYLEATGQSETYRKFLDEKHSGQREYDFLTETAERFNAIAPRLHLPGELEISDFLLVNLPNQSFQSVRIPKPRYYFYNERSETGYYNNVVSKLRPYSYDLLNGHTISILVVTPEEYEGSVGEYIVKLQRKLKELFHLGQMNFIIETITPPETYSDVINRLDPREYTLAIIVVSQQDKILPIPQSPYHLTKAKLLNQRLPTQELTIEVLRGSNMFTDNNIALNIYSKLGGTAWTIEKTEKNVSELIVGIGSTTDEEGNWVIGFANVFDYNGTYLVGDCSQLSTKEDYASNLERYLISTLTQSFDLKGISRNTDVRLIFHVFKEAGKKHEIRAITNALRHFDGYRIQFGLVHLSYSHNFRVHLDQGRRSPERGTFIQLSSRQAILHLGGRSVVPVQIRLDKRSNYKDIYAITKQVLYFAHLSYRTFMPPSKPVTIKYPALMAKLVSELSQVPGWDVAVLNKLNDKLWFI